MVMDFIPGLPRIPASDIAETINNQAIKISRTETGIILTSST